MTNIEYENAFEKRLPVFARIGGITAGKVVIQYSCISAITRRWSNKQNRAVTVLELLDKNSNSITTTLPEDCFLSLEEAEGHTVENNPSVNCVDSSLCTREPNGLWEVIGHYQKHIGGLATPAVEEGLEDYLKRGMSAEVIKRVIEYADENNSRSWRYIDRVLLGKATKGVKTLEDYNRDEKLWEERKKRTPHPSAKADTFPSRGRQKSKFNNYVDTNKPDYSNFSQQIIEDMLRESEG